MKEVAWCLSLPRVVLTPGSPKLVNPSLSSPTTK